MKKIFVTILFLTFSLPAFSDDATDKKEYQEFKEWQKERKANSQKELDLKQQEVDQQKEALDLQREQLATQKKELKLRKYNTFRRIFGHQ